MLINQTFEPNPSDLPSYDSIQNQKQKHYKKTNYASLLSWIITIILSSSAIYLFIWLFSPFQKPKPIYTNELLLNTSLLPFNTPHSVTYDHRAILIDQKRVLLLTGAIHYPRSSPGMWPELLQSAKDAGINTIDTYVFWNLHEPEKGVFNFEGNADLIHFLELTRTFGLYVNLRIGPYVCAEWYNFYLDILGIMVDFLFG
jgi:hypothetical protein